MRILLVEDERELADPLIEVLRKDSYAVDHAADGQTADELSFVNDYDLIILDWTIPPPSGLTLLQKWRERDNQTPVLMLTGRRDVSDRVAGLDSGADDYLTKPFSVTEFMARVRSLLRRRKKPLQHRMQVADVVMDRSSHQVTVSNKPLSLSPKEFSVLEYFLSHPDEVITRSQLIDHVWDESFDATSNVVDVTVYRLRSKIDGNNKLKLLHTVKGVGYVLKNQRS